MHRPAKLMHPPTSKIDAPSSYAPNKLRKTNRFLPKKPTIFPMAILFIELLPDVR